MVPQKCLYQPKPCSASNDWPLKSGTSQVQFLSSSLMVLLPYFNLQYWDSTEDYVISYWKHSINIVVFYPPLILWSSSFIFKATSTSSDSAPWFLITIYILERRLMLGGMPVKKSCFFCSIPKILEDGSSPRCPLFSYYMICSKNISYFVGFNPLQK